MKSFGFGVRTSRRIDLDTANFEPSDELFACEEALRACIGCGACVGGCTARNNEDPEGKDGMNFRVLHTHVRRGELASIQKEVSKCMLCGRCSLVCPRGINTRNVIMSIKRIFKQI